MAGACFHRLSRALPGTCSNLARFADTPDLFLETSASMKESQSVLTRRLTTVETDCKQTYQQSLTTMRIGFIGTGTITSSIVSGLNALDSTTFTFLLSPRNAGVGAALAAAFDNVTVAASNQAVLDGCDNIMLAVRPQVAVDVLESLRFRPDHHVISLIALISLERVQALVAPATRVVRAIPLPMVATRAGVTALYPADSTARAIFTQLGSTIALDSPEHCASHPSGRPEGRFRCFGRCPRPYDGSDAGELMRDTLYRINDF